MGNKPSIWAIIPAAGIGSRMQADKPKQYLSLGERTVLEQSVHRLASHPRISGIIVAIAENDPWWTVLPEYTCPIVTTIGGETRADSVLQALQTLSEQEKDAWALVHDAARPCLRHTDIDKMLAAIFPDSVGGILGMPVSDTMKRVNAAGEVTETVSRQNLWRAATPQLFQAAALQEALIAAKEAGQDVTDEASAMELAGHQPLMVAGYADNIKITLPQDLALATLYLQQQREEGRCG